MHRAEAVSRLGNRELAALMERSRPAHFDELAGHGFRGTSLGLPRWVERLSWKTFAKVFVAHRGGLHGFNLRIDQRSTTPLRPRAGRPRFGEFEVVCGAETVLDYGRKSPKLSPLSTLRDTLVVVSDDPLILLGRSYLQVAGHLLPTPSYFTLERALALPAGVDLDTAHLGIDAV